MPYPRYIQTIRELKEYNKLPIEEKQRLYREDIINFYNNLKPFNNNINKIPELPAVNEWCTKEMYDEVVVSNLIRCGAIPKSELEIGAWYIGKYRNSQYGRWNGKTFEHEIFECGFWFKETKQGNHFEDDNGYALFVPLKKIDKPDDLHLNWD